MQDLSDECRIFNINSQQLVKVLEFTLANNSLLSPSSLQIKITDDVFKITI